MTQPLGQLDPVGGGDPIPLLKPLLQIGRRSQCDITLRFPNVSSHHCELILKDGYWFVQDCNSSNGIKVNGIRCRQQYLMPGDVLSIARHEFEINYEPEGTEPPPQIEEDIMSMSLLEKAGLVSRKRDAEGRPEKPVPKPVARPPIIIETPDDEAMHWLSNAETPDPKSLEK